MQYIVIVIAIAFLLACGAEPASDSNVAATPPGSVPAPAAPAAPSPPDATPAEAPEVEPGGSIEIEVGDQIRYSLTRFKAKSGEQITVTLRHTGQQPAQIMGHNIVFLLPGTDVQPFAIKAVQARDADYIPESERGSILAHTRLIGGGETDSVSFTPPAPGTYPFVCTFPGHFTLMRGELIVE